MSQREVVIKGGPNNTSALVTGQQELLVKVNSPIPLEVAINEANDSILIYGFDGAANQPISVTPAGEVNIRELTCDDEVSLCFDNAGTPTQVSDTNPLPVAAAITFSSSLPVTQDPSSNPWTVDGSVSITGEVEIINAVGSPIPVTIVAPVPVINVNLDAADDQVGVYGYLNGVSSTPIPLNVNASGQVAIQDGGNSITVDGTVNVGNFPASVEISNDVGNSIPVLQQYPASPYASAEISTGIGTTPVVFSAGTTSMSVQNLGNDNITIDTNASSGIVLPPGVSITWDAPVGQRFDTFTFTGSSVSSLFIVTAVIAS